MSVVEEIKERLDIVEIVGRSVRLQKAGRSLKGLCPFHTEKTPSFFVFPDSQRWHCFGCDKGGDVFTFVMEHEGWDFRTALEELGRQAGVELRPRTPAQAQAATEAERLRAALKAATHYYHTLLLTAPQAQKGRSYLEKRGFKPETNVLFQVGYSLKSWDALRAHLLGKGFTVEELVKAGLLVQKDDGGTYDRFRDRLMIPIRDRRGQVIAFGGRVLNPEDEPKYINSPQTTLFDKSRTLFGLSCARQAIRQADAAIIVEGYMDVMIPYQAGYHNIVAPMGTALTEAHLKQLQRLTRHFILALDPDTAGIQATLRSLETARQTLDHKWDAVFDPRGLVGYEGRLNADIRVVVLPDGLDPDELVLQDPARWEQLLASAQPIVRFYFTQLLQREDPQEPKGKARIVDAMLPLLRDISNNIEREAYAQEIALQLGLDARMLLDRLRVRERVAAVRRGQAAGASLKKSQLPADLEGHALHILLHFPALLEQVDIYLVTADLEPLHDEDFTLGCRLIWETWLEVLADPTQELQELLPSDLQEQIHAWGQIPTPEVPVEHWEKDLARTILILRERRVRETLHEVQGLVIAAQAEGDMKAVRYAPTFNDLHALLGRIQRASARADEILLRKSTDDST